MAVNKKTYPLLQRKALTPQLGPRSRGEEEEQSTERETRVSPSLSSLIHLDGRQKSTSASPLESPSISRALSVPETHLCSIASPSSGFTSITITARRISLSLPSLVSPEMRLQDQRNELPANSSVSTLSPCDETAQRASVPWVNLPVPLKHKATVVKVTGYRHKYYTGERFVASLTLPECSNSNTEGKRASQTLAGSKEEPALASSPSASKCFAFRSCVHLEILPSPSSSMLYLDKSLYIPLAGLQEGGQALHRSTLSLSLRASLGPSGPKRPGGSPLSGAHSGQGLAARGRNVMRDACCHLEGVTTVDSGAVGSVSSSESSPPRVTLPTSPFRARRRSSAAVFGQNEKANDVSRLRKGGVGRAPVKYVSGVNMRASSKGRGTRSHPETAARRQARPVSPRAFDAATEPNSTNRPQALSLQDALEQFRPDFISRSQKRVRQMEEKARGRQTSQTADFSAEMEGTNKRRNCTKPHPLCDNLFKPKDRVISGKEMQLRSRRIYNKLPEVTKKKEEERRRLVLQTNRLRAEVFKKKLLDQILQRNSD